jgi:type VI protein secretion system component VasK
MRRVFWGIIIILVGLWIWAGTLGLPDVYRFGKNWPILLILLGGYIVYRSVKRWARRRVRKVDVLGELEKGRIDVDEAVEGLKQGK